MRKSIISILLLLLCISIASADGFVLPQNSIAGFSINVPAVDTFLQVYFYTYATPTHTKLGSAGLKQLGNNSTTNMTAENDGSVPSLAFRVKTRHFYEVGVRLTFLPMINDDKNADPGYKYGFYGVTIYNPLYWNDEYLDGYVESGVLCSFDVDEVNGVTELVTTPERHIPESKDGIDTWLYPMAFDFSSFIDGYNGAYTATIKMEVLSQ